MRKILVFLLVLAMMASPLVAEEETPSAGVSASDILLSDIPIAYGDEAFRERILERTGGARSPIGLVLSGGSARAMAHIGVLRYLEEKNIVPDYIISNSMGSIVGLLYSAGMSPDQIEEVVLHLNLEHVIDFTLPVQGGLLKADALASLAVSILGENLRLEDLAIPLIVVQEDLVTKRQILVSEGDFATIFRSSFAIPVYFPSVAYKGHLLVDGGISNLAPVDIAYRYSDDVIVSTTFSDRDDLNLRDPLTSLNTAFEIQKRREGVMEIKNHPSLIWIRCQVEQNSFMDFDLVREISQKGYEGAKKQDDALSSLPPGLGVASLSARREELAKTLRKGLGNYFLYDHVRQTDFSDTLGLEFNSSVAGGESYLKDTTAFGLDYRVQWGNFTFHVLPGINYSASVNEYFSISPSFLTRLDYYAWNHLRISALADVDWDAGSIHPGIYLRQALEAKYYFLGNRLRLRLLEGFEHLHATNEKRAFVGRTMLLNMGAEGTYLAEEAEKNWSLSGSGTRLSYQLLGNYKVLRHFLDIDANLFLKVPSDMFVSARSVFRFALDGRGNVPLFFRDGFRTNKRELRDRGHDLSSSPTPYLISTNFMYGYRFALLKPSFGEIVIIKNTSVAAYCALLFTGGLPEVGVGAQLESTVSFLGMKDFPFTLYCGYDSAARDVVWGFSLSCVLT